MNQSIFSAHHDWDQFCQIFNSCTQYAPYSMRLTGELVERSILPFAKDHEDIVLIASSGSKHGVMHGGIYQEGDVRIGALYMLLANDNELAECLLAEAEVRFRSKGITNLMAYWWYPNPYQYILHGAEVYGWAGAYAAMNAYRRLHYDIALDIVVMSRDISEKPAVLPANGRLELVETVKGETDLAWSAEVVAYVDGKRAGQCGYVHLKGISDCLRKGIGQFNIATDTAIHGQDIGRSLLRFAEGRLYDRGVRRMQLATNQELFRAIKFYEKMGYQPEAIRAYSFSKKVHRHKADMPSE